MKLIAVIVFFAGCMLTDFAAKAQDTLPAFTVTNRNGKVILSWVNNFPIVKQMSIQRSSDSLKGFKTILTLPDPTSVTNGFLDNNAPDTLSFYKLYILLDSGKYLFSKSKKPERPAPPVVKAVTPKTQPEETAAISVKKETKPEEKKTEREQQHTSPATSPAITKETATIKDTATAKPVVSTTSGATPKPVEPPPAEEPPSKKYERESIKATAKRRSDGLKGDTVTQVTKVEIYKPSGFVFTNSEGNITIVLPAGKQSEFRIRFYDEDGSDLFQLNSIREQIVIVDKSNFMRSGWFRFELYEKDVLKEKNKILIPKDTMMR